VIVEKVAQNPFSVAKAAGEVTGGRLQQQFRRGEWARGDNDGAAGNASLGTRRAIDVGDSIDLLLLAAPFKANGVCSEEQLKVWEAPEPGNNPCKAIEGRTSAFHHPGRPVRQRDGR
jgi:hypothetical protein